MPIFQKFMIHVVFGEDIDSETTVTMNGMVTGADGRITFERKEMTLSDAIEEAFKQCLTAADTRIPNPLWNFYNRLTGKNLALTKMERESTSNSVIVRAVVSQYVRKRMNGVVKNTLNNSDLLTLFLQSPDVFTEEIIVDEIVDFMVAGTVSTMNVSQTIISHFATDSTSLNRLRTEFAHVVSSREVATEQLS